MSLTVDNSSLQSALSTQKDQLLQRAGGGTKESRENAKIEKAGKDFESILLGNWLQQAENSFAKVPGGDGQEDDADAGKDQFQGLAMQSLATSLTASGGIGIAKMITKHLLASSEKATDNATGKSLMAAHRANVAPPETRTK
jgi:Rod binding domain-containing protein